MEEILQKLGCSKQEVEIFLICLELGPIGISSVARKANIARTTIYTHINKLKEKRLLKSQNGNHGAVYTAISFKDLMALLQIQKEKWIDTYEQGKKMSQIYNEVRKGKSAHRVNYYEGYDIYDNIAQKIIKNKTGYYLTNIDAILNFKGRELNELINSFKKNTAHIKEIIFESQHQDEYIEKLSSKKHQIKILPVGIAHNYKSDIGMTDGFYYHMAFGKNINAIEIENEIFFETHTKIFEELRNRL